MEVDTNNNTSKYKSFRLFYVNNYITSNTISKKRHNINNLDNFFFTGKTIKPYKIGEYIQNIGLVIDKPQIFNVATKEHEKCCLIFQSLEKNGVFRLLKNDSKKIKKLSTAISVDKQTLDLHRKYGFYTFDEILSKMGEKNPQVSALFNELRIAEIGHVRVTDPKDKQHIINAGYKPFSNSDMVFIEGFFVKKKEYENVGRFIYSTLIKALNNNGDKDIIITARAMGKGAASPIRYYLRLGFKPFTKTVQEIELNKIKTPKGEKIDPNYKVSMFLPPNAHLYSLCKNYETLDEINKVKPNWFNVATETN